MQLLSARTSEFGLGGYYVDTLNPLPEGILSGCELIETMARSRQVPEWFILRESLEWAWLLPI